MGLLVRIVPAKQLRAGQFRSWRGIWSSLRCCMGPPGEKAYRNDVLVDAPAHEIFSQIGYDRCFNQSRDGKPRGPTNRIAERSAVRYHTPSAIR